MTGRICHESYRQNLAKKNKVIFGNKYSQETAGKSADPRYHFADAMIYEALTKYYTSRIGEAQGEVRKVAAMWNVTLLKSIGELLKASIYYDELLLRKSDTIQEQLAGNEIKEK